MFHLERGERRHGPGADRGRRRRPRANVVCLPELFAGHYPCQSEDHRKFAEAEPIPGPTSQALAEAARRHGVVVIGSLFERRGPGLYHNTAVVWDADGRQAGLYRKMHIPDDPCYYEKFYFTPGDLGFPSFPTRYGRVGVVRLLGPVVSRGRPAGGPFRRRDHLLSHGHRLAGRARRRSSAPASTRPGRR